LFTTILLTVLLVATVAAALVLPKIRLDRGTSYERTLSPAWALIPLTLFLVFGAFACTAIVAAKTEGVLLTFQKPADRVLDSGLAVKAPWQDVVEVDGTRKTDNFNDGSTTDAEDSTQNHADIQCRLGDNGVAEVKASIQWRRADGVSNRVYEEYRGEDPVFEMRENLVVPRFREAINETCASYRPTEAIDALDIDFSDPEKAAAALKDLKLAPDTGELSEQAKALVEEKLGGEDALVAVEHVAISYVALPQRSQDTIQSFQDEAQRARTALLSQSTAAAQARANKILSDSISNDPNVLVSKCFDLIEAGKLVLPAGGSCWPGAGGGVVIPSAR
jgi:regulator of protease activity HflC (stomatin/prohibitin superfamily)